MSSKAIEFLAHARVQLMSVRLNTSESQGEKEREKEREIDKINGIRLLLLCPCFYAI